MTHSATSSRGDRLDTWSPDRPATASKRSLIAVSHVIERALLEGPLTEPTVVVAMFQRLAYMEREYQVYARLAEAGAVVVLGFADGEAHQVPPGCHGIVLDPDEPLADEWTVIAVGPHAGAYLVATDAHRFDPTEQTLEAGREFDGRWGYSRVQAGNELARMRVALGSRLGTAVTTTIDHLLARVMPAGGTASGSRGTDGEMWATISLHRMIDRMQDARAGTRVLRAQLVDAHAAVAARGAAHTDPQSGLTSPEFLSRWTDTGRPTALPVGVAVIDVPALDGADDRYDSRAVWHASRRVAAALTEPLGPVDAAVRLSDREFALVVPGASNRHLRQLVSAVGEQLELASDGYPGIALSGRVATTVTLTRPLPLDDLHLALGAPDQPAATLAGDPITVVSTAASMSPGPTNGRPITDALPRVRVGSVPTTAPQQQSPTEVAEPSEPVGSDTATPATGIRASIPDDRSAARNGTSNGHHEASAGMPDREEPTDTPGVGESAESSRRAEPVPYDEPVHPGEPVHPDEPIHSDEPVHSDEPDAPGRSVGLTELPPPQAAGDPPDDEVTRRADRTMNVLAGLPRRHRRNGQYTRSDTGARAFEATGGPGFTADGVDVGGRPPQGTL